MTIQAKNKLLDQNLITDRKFSKGERDHLESVQEDLHQNLITQPDIIRGMRQGSQEMIARSKYIFHDESVIKENTEELLKKQILATNQTLVFNLTN
jgi:hypothetical protein